MAEQTLPRQGAGAQSNAAPDAAEWQAIERDPDFKQLVQEKRSFILPWTIFFIVFYFAFLVIVGYVPSVANAEVIGHVNVAYLLALLQFVVAWALMVLYVRRAAGFDALVDRIVKKFRGGKA
jgi:uncharacterized membrane protein (DUF485 family)